MKKLLITVGGTGGHIFPALSVAKGIKNVEILFAGGKLSKNPYFDHTSHAYEDISTASFSSRNPLTLLRDAWRIGIGIWQSLRIIRRFKPDLILGFGSFYTFPMLLAARSSGIPFILHEANSYPGKVNRLMSPYAQLTGIQFPITARYLKGSTRVVPLPLRPGYHKTVQGKQKALAHYGLDPAKTTVLIFGGSQGAQAINQLVADTLKIMPPLDVQFIHLTGKSDIKLDYAKQGFHAVVKSFENNMALAWQAADLIISRSGANTIAEQMAFEVPGILIPYPFATEQHQDKNADYMVEVGGAEKYPQGELTPAQLVEILARFIHDKEKLSRMRESIVKYKEAQNSPSLSSVIIEMI